MKRPAKFGKRAGTALLVWLLLFGLMGQEPQALAQQPTTLRVTTAVVLVNVVVRDKKGNAIPNLKQADFTVYEDGQKQQVLSFDYEHVDELATAGPAGRRSRVRQETVPC